MYIVLFPLFLGYKRALYLLVSNIIYSSLPLFDLSNISTHPFPPFLLKALCHPLTSPQERILGQQSCRAGSVRSNIQHDVRGTRRARRGCEVRRLLLHRSAGPYLRSGNKAGKWAGTLIHWLSPLASHPSRSPPSRPSFFRRVSTVLRFAC